MRLKGFRVQMYRSILDSTWVDVDDITVIVGKNESGKTALLKALHKFNPFSPEPYTLDREWPREHRQKRSLDTVVVQTRFEFDEDEIRQIATIIPSGSKTTGVEISKDYEELTTYEFLPKDLEDFESMMTRLQDEFLDLHQRDESLTEAGLDRSTQMLEEAEELIEKEDFSTLKEKIGMWKHEILGDQPSIKNNNVLDRSFDRISKLIDLITTRSKVEDMVSEWIPTFIYMDEHKPFQGSAHLDQIKGRKDSDQLTEEDKTFLMILEMAGLDFEDEYQRATESDSEQRMLDMNDASSRLTNLLADHWSQRSYEVHLKADGYHVIAFVNDEIQSALVPLNERSKGFQWFFSFDTTFLHETQGTFKNAVILLDEPGLHLHGAAQWDLLERLKEYARSNQLIYTTHMPFMINMERINNIRICKEDKDKGTTVSEDLYSADSQTWLPLQMALGWLHSQSLFIGPYNLVVEGKMDYELLSAMAKILRSEDRDSLDERIVITPAGAATKAAYVATMFRGQKLNVVVLLDSDPEGEKVAADLVKKWIMKDKHVLLLGPVLGREEETALEDMFPDEFYINYVNRAYEKELKGKPIDLAEGQEGEQQQLVRRIEAAFRKRGMKRNSEGKAFNKGRAAKLLLAELPKRSLADLPEEMVKRFQRLFKSINEAMPGI